MNEAPKSTGRRLGWRCSIVARRRSLDVMVVETPLQIKAVAQATGFDDEFYFSRRFWIEVGQSPRAYRNTYRLWR